MRKQAISHVLRHFLDRLAFVTLFLSRVLQLFGKVFSALYYCIILTALALRRCFGASVQSIDTLDKDSTNMQKTPYAQEFGPKSKESS